LEGKPKKVYCVKVTALTVKPERNCSSLGGGKKKVQSSKGLGETGGRSFATLAQDN